MTFKSIFQEKEGLITELRKELRLSNEEHRDLLNRVNADETIRRIRFYKRERVLFTYCNRTYELINLMK